MLWVGGKAMTRGFSVIALCDPKTESNVGSVLRAAHCYGASMVVTHGARLRPDAPTNTPKAHRHIPFMRVDNIMDHIPYGCVPVVVELEPGSTPIQDFPHPERAFYILGPEDGSVPSKISQACKHHVYIPTNGCMNLAATANVILFDRMMKRKEYRRENL
jgi:tRNA(Leu) C34 or U34 (ribose-2'-O)-methylase TrmL